MSAGRAAINGRVLDELEEILRGRSRDEAITSAELAERLPIDDSSGQPATREAIGILRASRGVPIRAGNCGYWVCQSDAEAQDYLDTLLERIAGIEGTMEEFADAWEAWSRRSDVPDEYAGEIPPQVYEQIEDDPVLTPEDYINEH